LLVNSVHRRNSKWRLFLMQKTTLEKWIARETHPNDVWDQRSYKHMIQFNVLVNQNILYKKKLHKYTATMGNKVQISVSYRLLLFEKLFQLVPVSKVELYSNIYWKFLFCGLLTKMQCNIGQQHYYNNFLKFLTCKLPLEQYCVTIQMLGASTHAPINWMMLSCLKSRIWKIRKLCMSKFWKDIQLQLEKTSFTCFSSMSTVLVRSTLFLASFVTATKLPWHKNK